MSALIMAGGGHFTLGNIGAEQALLGALLFDNEAFYRLPDLKPEHFSEPLNGQVFAAAQALVKQGRTADAITVPSRFANGAMSHDDLSRLLVDLVDASPPAANAPDYAAEIMAQALRRDLYRFGDQLANQASKNALPPEDLLAEAEKALLGMRAESAKARPLTAAEAVEQVFQAMGASEDTGARSGLDSLDKHLGPMLGGELIVVCGRPGMGKSALAGVVATNVAMEQGLGVEEVSLEMSVVQLYRRRLCEIAQRLSPFNAPAYADVRRKRISVEQQALLHRAAELIRPTPMVSLAKTGVSIEQIGSQARRQFSQWLAAGVTPGVLVIDHLGLVIGEGKSRYEQQTHVAMKAKELAGDLGVPVIALAQLSREVERRDDKRPLLSDLRDSGAIEESADVVLGVYRDAYYANQEPEPKKETDFASWDARRRSREIEVILLKVREGRQGTVKLWGDMATNAIRSEAPGFNDLLD